MFIIICAAIALGIFVLTQGVSEKQSQSGAIAIPVRVYETINPPSRMTRR